MWGKRAVLWLLLACVVSSFVVANTFVDEFSAVEQVARDFMDDVEGAVIIEGLYASKAERLWLAYTQEQYPSIRDLPRIDDTRIPTNEKIILVGGPNQNRLVQEIFSKSEPTYTSFILGVLATGEYEGRQYIVFSDHLGYKNVARTGPYTSPLNKIMPTAYVPLAATAAAFFLLWLWKFLLVLFKKFVKLFATNKVMSKVKKKKLKEEYSGFTLFGMRIKWREWLAIFIAAAVFALSISYTHFFTRETVVLFILTNVIVNFIIYTIRHLVRLFMDRKHKLHTEYTIWWWGAAITVLSGWLGNTFGLAGYTMSGTDKHAALEGKIAFTLNVLTFIVSLLFFVWNVFWPAVIIQMLMLMSLAICALQMLPFTPFAGRKMRIWKTWAWWVAIIPIWLFYIGIAIVL